jgi:hypothetical protein
MVKRDGMSNMCPAVLNYDRDIGSRSLFSPPVLVHALTSARVRLIKGFARRGPAIRLDNEEGHVSGGSLTR